ncbi:hypothetical protein CLA01_09360 [Chryseobacterium lathyri]|uniref:Uncharacterized protein n=2 Tax=Chryseobacterium lathyri TaxID=395933 RepID=A0A511Y6P8_9FLAO|nr:hypothetical protein CLA01_09360 [Chryseobacterium lathyri]
MGSLFVTGLKSNSSKNVASALTAEELVERLDLEKAHLNSNNGKEVFHVPVRTFGSYKRSLLSISGNGNSMAVLLTYPNPEDQRLFYITDLNGNLLKEVKIGDDGKELPASPTSKKSSIAGKSDDLCEEVVYETCSSGQHSFETGNAYQCEFWHNLQGGTPPKLFKINGICGGTGSGGGGTPIGGDGSSGGHPAGGSSTSPVGGGGPPKYDFTSADCVQNLDCENCNIPGDTNNDCKLSYDEAIAFNNNPCEKTKGIINNPKTKTAIDDMKNQAVLPASDPNSGEIGYKFQADGTPSTKIIGGAHNVNFGDKTGYAGGYHNHTLEGIPMLSPPDIEQLLQFVLAQGNYGNPSNAFMGMVAPNGMHYVATFSGNYNDALISFSQQDLNNFTDNMAMRKGMYNPSTPNGFEKLFFAILNDMSLNGKVNLQRIESDGTIKTIIKNNDGTTTAVPCP